MRQMVRITGALAVALFAVLVILSKGWLEPPGFTVFDGRFGGYDVEYARDYLAALSDSQTALYLGLFRWLDTAMPILLAVTLAGVIWSQATGSQKIVRGIIALSPCVYLALDLTENAAVAHLLQTGPQVSAGAILQASALTVGKWISLTLAMLLVVWAWRLSPKGTGAA